LRPLTLGRPKPMIPVGPEPAIYYILSQLSREGFKEIVMVTGYGREQIMEYLGDGSKLGVQITYAVKPDEFICGTAGSLKLVEHMLDDTFLVAQADTLSEISLREAVSFHQRKAAHATVVLTKVNNPSDFGVAVLDEDGVIVEFQEKPKKEEARSDLVSTGFYVLEPDVLDHIENERWDFARDLFPRLLKLHKRTSGFVSESFWLDMGNLPGYLRGVRWVLDGMTVGETLGTGAGGPNRAVVEREAQVGPGVRIAGPALVESGVLIEDGANINQYCVLKKDARVLSGAVLDWSVVMERAVVGKDCTVIKSVIGQSAVLQGNVTVKGSIIGAGCVIGDRVEVLEGSRIWPNIRIGADAKVNGTMIAPVEKAFYFYTDFGQYVGLMATSLDDFIEALEKAPIESIEFHTKRRDYERWTRDVLASNELADSIEDLRKSAITGEPLRRGLIRAMMMA
jgi:mannose-1-phosphate guanylyltransferase / phosphomannomutase